MESSNTIRFKEDEYDVSLRACSLNRNVPCCYFCGLANKKGIYKCPRCEMHYCGVECYKSASHSACNEEFYKQQCLEALQSQYSTEESRKTMVDILKRELGRMSVDGVPAMDSCGGELSANVPHAVNGAEDTGDDDSDEDSDLDSDQSVGLELDLDDEKLQDFHRKLESGAIGQCVWPLRPWWIDSKLVRETRKTDRKLCIPQCAIDAGRVCPNPPVTRRSPHATLMYHAVAIAGCYSLLYRKYHGQLSSDPSAAMATLLDICPLLVPESSRSSTNPVRNMKDAVDMCLYHATELFTEYTAMDHTFSYFRRLQSDLNALLVNVPIALQDSKANQTSTELVPMMVCLSELISLTNSVKSCRDKDMSDQYNPFSKLKIKTSNLVSNFMIAKKLEYFARYVSTWKAKQYSQLRNDLTQLWKDRKEIYGEDKTNELKLS